jgi:hypothetical protein
VLVSIPDLVSVAETALRRSFDDVTLSEPVLLSSSSRSHVVRARFQPSPASRGSLPVPGSVIVKTYDLDLAPEAAVREAAALDLLGRHGDRVAPYLLAVAEDPALVVLSDLGDDGRVSDALMRGTPAAAADAVVRWAEAIARLHRQTVGHDDEYDESLRAHASRLRLPVPATDGTAQMLAGAVDLLTEHLPALGVDLSTAAVAELLAIDSALDQSGRLRALTPADACPDNNLRTGHGLRLIDFEFAQVRHVAWDLAYLTVPWPSCWCSWRLPEEVSAQARARWKAVANLTADPRTIDADLQLATVAWCLISAGWFLPSALEDPPYEDPDVGALAAPRRALILNRLQLVEERRDPRVPQLTSLATRTAAALRAAWGPLDLPLAPAWR